MENLENEGIVDGIGQDVKLPENAYRELKSGDEYKPILLAEKKYPELNAWTIVWGIIMAIIFSAATAYAGLRFEPGSIISDCAIKILEILEAYG